MGYPGSKAQAGVFQRIIGQMPPHDLYVEPFFGSGQVFWRKRRAPASIVIDQIPSVLTKVGTEPGVRAILGNAISLLPKLGRYFVERTVIYCDPPYLLQSRQNRRYYDYELSEKQHRRLLEVLQELPFQILLSGYPSELYGRTLRDWRCIEYRTRTRGRTVTECLWCNFPEPAELHDWRFAGKTFRERLYLRRLATRWLARLDAMPARKRGYVLNAVHQRWS